jgi:outer membrane protein TolC
VDCAFQVSRRWFARDLCRSLHRFDAGKRSALVRERRAEVSEAQEDLERTKEEVGVRIATIYNKLETTRAWLRSLEKILPRGRRMPGSLKSNSSEAFC